MSHSPFDNRPQPLRHGQAQYPSAATHFTAVRRRRRRRWPWIVGGIVVVSLIVSILVVPKGYRAALSFVDESEREFTAAATPSAPGTGPRSEIIPDLVLPAGSTVEIYRSQEYWTTPVPYPDAVESLRAQLPIGGDHGTLRWCSEKIEKEVTMWAWGDATDFLYVMVDGSLGRGSDVSINREWPSPTGC